MVRNAPYSGGFITRNYGQPAQGVHALQIEINRGLYMHEPNFSRSADMAEVVANMSRLTERLVGLEPQALAA